MSFLERMSRRLAIRRGLVAVAGAAAGAAVGVSAMSTPAAAGTYCGNSGPCHSTPGMCALIDADGNSVPDGCVCCGRFNATTGAIINSRCMTSCSATFPTLIPAS